MLLRRSVPVVAVLALTAALPATAAVDWVFDPPHTQATFTVTHLAISKVRGSMPLVNGTLTPGAADVPSAVTATFDATKIDTHDGKRDESMRSAEWFDVAKYPTIRFVSTKVTGTAQAFEVAGNLTVHGVTRPVVLKGHLEGTITDGKGVRHVAYTATTQFDRRDFGMTWGNMSGGQLIAGYDVHVDVEADAVEKPVR